MYYNAINEILSMMKKYGDEPQPPCGDIELLQFRSQARERLGIVPDDSYCTFLKQINGLDWNGLVAYAAKTSQINGYDDRFVEGFIEANSLLRESSVMAPYVVYAEDGVVFHAYNLERSKFEVITRVGLTVLGTYYSFNEMLMNALASVK